MSERSEEPTHLPAVGRVIAAAAAVVLTLSSSPAALSASPPAPDLALPLLPKGPTLVVATGARIESIAPETGSVLGGIAPFSLPDFAWVRFLRKGRFLLAEGRSSTVAGPVHYYARGLALLDHRGRVMWTKTQAMLNNRVSPAVFLDDDGYVAFDSIEKPGIIAPDGTMIDTDQVPAGPLLHGERNVLPLRNWCSDDVTSWLRLDTRQFSDLPPDYIVKVLPITAMVDNGRIALGATVDPYPENDIFTFSAKTLGQMPLPPACRGAETDVQPTMSPQYELLSCWKYRDADALELSEEALFVIDVKARNIRPIKPPRSNQSDVPREFRRPDSIAATVRGDGAIVASVWNNCTGTLYMSSPGKGWIKSSFVPPFGPPVSPERLCDRLTLQPTTMPYSGGCGSAQKSNPNDVTYVEREDGTWLTLPYKIGGAPGQACSNDRLTVAFVRSKSLVVARLDRDLSRVIRSYESDAPYAWLP